MLIVVALSQPMGLPEAEGEKPAAAKVGRSPIPSLFWVFAGALVVYGIAETMFGNWGTTLLVEQRRSSHIGPKRASRVLGGDDRGPVRHCSGVEPAGPHTYTSRCHGL